MTLNAFVLFKRSTRLTLTALSALIISGCSERLAPDTIAPGTFPSQVPSSRLAERVDKQRQDAFPLANGSFRAMFIEDGKTVGTVGASYSGTALNSGSGSDAATLGFQVRQTTGSASGVTAVKADGSGAFTGEGEFTLSLSLARSKAGTITAKVRGTSAISCTDGGRILVTMRGTGSAPRAGTLSVELQHEVENTNCF